jgi:alkyl sulfatase BDS1-like metallo-beta-lactamase superfamily hydrolase
VAFGAEYGNMTVVGHRNVERRLERYVETNDWNVQINARQFGGVKGDFGMGDFPDFIPSNTARPDHIVDDRDTLRIGSRTVELHHARGETDDHLWAWMPEEKWMAVGDFVIWNFPNAGNPQKVQRFPIEWAAALREMIAKEPELLLPAHGLPIEGRARIAGVLDDIATALELIVREVVDMMNAGEVLDTIVHSVTIPEDLLSKPYLRPLYDEPEFVVRGVWRQFGGWWDGAPSRLKPAPDAVLAVELAELAGGAGRLIERAQFVAEQGEFRLACHLADLAGWAAPVDRGIHRQRAIIYRARRKRETSLMAKGIFAGAARESEGVAGKEA